MDHPLEKFRFSGRFKTSLFWSKNPSFLSRISKTIFSGLICEINTLDRIFDFLTKPWTNRFEKFPFSGPFKNLAVWSKKHSILSRTSKNIFSDLICLKNILDKIFDFFDKNLRLTSSKKFRFLDFLKLYFLGLKAFFSIQNIKKRSFLT